MAEVETLKVPGPVLLLDRQVVSSLLTWDECIRRVEAAFRAYAEGRALTPRLMHVNASKGEFHIKAGGLSEPTAYFVCKVGAGFFDNRQRFGLPNIIGLILLCDGTSGAPLAILESGLITRMRTGASTAVAARYLARPDSSTVTVCGAGAQAEAQLRALRHVLPLNRAFVWSRGDTSRFCKDLRHALDMEVLPAPDLKSATLNSDVVVTCTPSRHWILGREHIRPGTFIAAVGADSPDKQELEPELLRTVSVVCDLIQQCADVGDLHHAVVAGLMKPDQIRGELGAVVTGAAPSRMTVDEVIVFDSTGTALQDVAAAAAVYERARKADLCAPTLEFWN